MKSNIKRLSLCLSALMLLILASPLTVLAAEEEVAASAKFYGTFWSLVPPLVAIALALITKEVYSSLFVGILALLGYSGFAEYGLNIVAAFDENDAIIGTSKSGKPIMHLSRLGEICRREQIKIGIITVPAEQAQGVCDLLISNGILAIWNFAPKHLNVPDHILVQNENMAASLALLCKHLNEQMKAEE